MEGGNPLLEYVTYGIIGIVLCALTLLALRTAWFFLSLLAIPLAEAAARWKWSGALVARWGDRGARRDPTTWRHLPAADSTAIDSTPRAEVPHPVKRGMMFGAVLGALPGVWLAARGAQRAIAANASAGEIAAAIGMGVGLVGAAGALGGGALGALAGGAWDALASRRSR